MKGIYLAAFEAYHPDFDLVYQDINGKRDIPGDMMDVDLTSYDFIIATPPCNYYSRANYRREKSEYSQKTKHLLPDILDKLIKFNKPFIVENVRNQVLMNKLGLFDKPCFIYFIGRHTYWTNIFLVWQDIKQFPIVEIVNGKKLYLSSQNLSRSKRQGTNEVHEVIERFLNAL